MINAFFVEIWPVKYWQFNVILRDILVVYQNNPIKRYKWHCDLPKIILFNFMLTKFYSFSNNNIKGGVLYRNVLLSYIKISKANDANYKHMK